MLLVYNYKLTNSGRVYRWGFPFKLLVDYRGKTVLKTSQQAKEFEIELDSEEVDVQVLNQNFGGRRVS